MTVQAGSGVCSRQRITHLASRHAQGHRRGPGHSRRGPGALSLSCGSFRGPQHLTPSLNQASFATRESAAVPACDGLQRRLASPSLDVGAGAFWVSIYSLTRKTMLVRCWSQTDRRSPGLPASV